MSDERRWKIEEAARKFENQDMNTCCLTCRNCLADFAIQQVNDAREEDAKIAAVHKELAIKFRAMETARALASVEEEIRALKVHE